MLTKEELQLLIDVTEWTELRAHLDRGGVIVVDGSLDLADAAVKIAGDGTDIVSLWIAEGKVNKPTNTQITQWNIEKQKKFSMLILSPFVLIQEQ